MWLIEYWVVIFFNDVAFLIKNYKIIYNWYIFYSLLQVLLQNYEWHLSHYLILFLYNKNANAHTMLRHCASNVFALCVHCSCNSALVSWFFFFFFFFNSWFVFFFSFKYWCKLTFILLYWHNKFHNIFTIIDVSISYKSK